MYVSCVGSSIVDYLQKRTRVKGFLCKLTVFEVSLQFSHVHRFLCMVSHYLNFFGYLLNILNDLRQFEISSILLICCVI